MLCGVAGDVMLALQFLCSIWTKREEEVGLMLHMEMH